MNKETEILNNFFSRFDLNDAETRLKQKCQIVKQMFDSASTELQAKRSELLQKEVEVNTLNDQLNALLQLALEIEQDRQNKLVSPAQGNTT